MRGCIVSPDLSVLNLVIVKQGNSLSPYCGNEDVVIEIEVSSELCGDDVLPSLSLTSIIKELI